jgi:GH15 family glucan-1,4-alpha-glucosidase
MAWLALDRVIRIAGGRGAHARQTKAWQTALDLLGEDIRQRGYDSKVGGYTAAYGSEDLDAAVLLLPALGFETADSPRVAGTIEAIRRTLAAGGPLLYRYLDPDGLPGNEGAFLPCSFWLVQALALTGRRDEARNLFDELMGYGGELGLYGEEMDPVTHEHLGNFPQALTHSTMLQAASALGE